MALRVDLTGPVLSRLTKDKQTDSGHDKTDVNDPPQTFRQLQQFAINSQSREAGFFDLGTDQFIPRIRQCHPPRVGISRWRQSRSEYHLLAILHSGEKSHTAEPKVG